MRLVKGRGQTRQGWGQSGGGEEGEGSPIPDNLVIEAKRMGKGDREKAGCCMHSQKCELLRSERRVAPV